MRRMFLLLCVSALLSSCYYKTSLTEKPTRAADARLAGTWTMIEPSPENKPITISLTADRQYSIAYDGDVHRAFHSEVAGLPLLSVEIRKFGESAWVLARWNLSEDGTTLMLYIINPELVPGPDRASMVRQIEKHLEHPEFFGAPAILRKEEAPAPTTAAAPQAPRA